MLKVETKYGYDIYELTEQECEENYYAHPCFAVFHEGEHADIGAEETSEGTLWQALEWCKEYRRD